MITAQVVYRVTHRDGHSDFPHLTHAVSFARQLADNTVTIGKYRIEDIRLIPVIEWTVTDFDVKDC